MRILFHISIFAQGLIPFIMAHLQSNKEKGWLSSMLMELGPTYILDGGERTNLRTSQRLSLRFGFREDTIIVDEDIFDVVTL